MNGRNGGGSRTLKNSIWHRTHGQALAVPCHWCKVSLTFDEATVDHEPPLAEGGRWTVAVLACWACNQRRAREQQARRNKYVRAVLRRFGRLRCGNSAAMMTDHYYLSVRSL